VRFKPVAVTAEDMELHKYTDPDTVLDDEGGPDGSRAQEPLKGFKRIEGDFILATIMNGSWVAHE
jgi:hypothetical protein